MTSIGPIVVVALCGVLTAQEKGSDVAELRLDNGLEVRLERVEDARAMGLFCFVKTGFDHDPPGQTGLAHLLEHLLMTAATPSRDEVWTYERWQQERAAANAMTRGPWTVFWSIGTRDQVSSDARRFADVLAGQARLTQELLDYERAKLLLEAGNMTEAVPGGVLQWRAKRSLMRGEPGGRQGIGVAGEVVALTLPRIEKQYRLTYRADRVLIVAVGQVDPQADQEFYRRTFAALPVPQTQMPAPVAVEGEPPSAVTPHERVGAPFATLAWRAPAPGDPDFPAFAVAALWLGQRAQRDFAPRGREGAGFFLPGLFALLEEPAVLFLNRRGEATQTLADLRAELEGWVEARARDERLVPSLALAKRELELLLDPLPRSPQRQRLVAGQPQLLYRVGMARGAGRLWGFPEDLWARLDAVQPEAVLDLIRRRLQPKQAVFVALEPKAQ